MGHNLRNRKRLSIIMDSRLADFVGRTFAVRCPRCRETKDLRVQDLVERHGARKVFEAVTKLRRSWLQCGSRPDLWLGFQP